MVHPKPNMPCVVATCPDICHSMQAYALSMQNMDWSCFSSELRDVDPLDLFPPSISDSIPSHAASNPSPGASDTYLRTESGNAEEDPASAVEKLASLNVALYECAKKLPLRDKMSTTSERAASTDASGSRKTRVFAIDEIFSLTNEFIEVMKSLLQCETSTTRSSTGHRQSDTQSTLSFPAESQLSHNSQVVLSQPTGSFSQLDEATISMIFSCHCRLAETYATIFQMMQACIQYSFTPQLNKNWVIVLPKLQIGSLASPPLEVDTSTPLLSATTSTYMLTLTMVSSQIWGQMAEIIKAGTGIHAEAGLGERPELVNIMLDTVIDRTSRVLKSINATNYILKQYSI
jgi:hypothetical protein